MPLLFGIFLIFIKRIKMKSDNPNPLSKLYRNKSVYVKLPSRGKYYPSGIELSVDQELGVFPMTAKDELVLKTPDSLFNGDAIIQLFNSCAPDIKNPKEIPACDVDHIILAIRAASEQYQDVSCSCPKCKKDNEFKIDILQILSISETNKTSNKIKVSDEVTVYVRPFTLETQLKSNIQQFETYRLQVMLNQDKDKYKQNEIEKMFSDAFKKIMDLTTEILSDSILKVEMINDDGEIIIVENQEHLKEWTHNMTKEVYHLLVNRVKELSEPSVNNEINVDCQHCNHNFKTTMDMNPVSFFIQGQQVSTITN